jgi:predicted RNA-binding Zn-ribbon protein involved in translation (DUF1610 family)
MFCSNCGIKIDATAYFCPNCGTAGATSSTQPTIKEEPTICRMDGCAELRAGGTSYCARHRAPTPVSDSSTSGTTSNIPNKYYCPKCGSTRHYMRDTEYRYSSWEGATMATSKPFCGDCGALCEVSPAWNDRMQNFQIERQNTGRKRAWYLGWVFALAYVGGMLSTTISVGNQDRPAMYFLLTLAALLTAGPLLWLGRPSQRW